MARFRIAMRTLRVVVAALALAAGPLLGASPVIAANPAKGTDELDVGCRNIPPWVGKCQQSALASPDGVTSWQDVQTLTAHAGDHTDTGHLKVGFDEQFAPDGTFEAIAINGQLDGSIDGGGQFRGSASIAGSIDGELGQLTVAGTATYSGSGDDSTSAGGGGTVHVDCESGNPVDTNFGDNGGADSPDISLASVPVTATLDASGGDCNFTVSIAINGKSVSNGSAVHGSGSASVELTISAAGTGPTPSPSGACGGPNSVSGRVDDNNGHLMEHVKVGLYDGLQPIGDATSTDLTGHYCLRVDPAAISGASLVVRASLEDGEHDPSLFKTIYAPDRSLGEAEVDLQPTDIGRSNVDVSFADTPSQPHLSDMATVHYESDLFVHWLLDKMGIPAAAFVPFTVVTFGPDAEGTYYDQPIHSAVLSASDSVVGQRLGPADECPENCEWHEISHHVLEVILGIADTRTAVACQGRTAHGGWSNSSTCDSVQEGAAMFLPTLASLDIDAGSGPGYATPDYAMFGSIEDNKHLPWDSVQFNGKTIYKEDFAVAELLWDLADATPTEDPTIPYGQIGDPACNSAFNIPETVGLGGIPLLQALAHAHVTTVADIYDALRNTSVVPQAAKLASVDLNGDGQADVTPLDVEFLAHGFHVIPDSANPCYRLGSVIARTDHVAAPSGGLVQRRQEPTIPASAIRFTNTGSGSATFSIDVSDATTSSHFDVKVGSGASHDVHLELPFYWAPEVTGVDLSSPATLPACGAAGQRTVTLSLSGPGLTTRTLDNCEFWHDVAAALGSGGSVTPGSPASSGSAATAGSAVAVTVIGVGTDAAGPGSPNPAAASASPEAAISTAAAPGPMSAGLVAVGVLVAIVLAVAIRFGFIRRSRRATGPAGRPGGGPAPGGG